MIICKKVKIFNYYIIFIYLIKKKKNFNKYLIKMNKYFNILLITLIIACQAELKVTKEEYQSSHNYFLTYLNSIVHENPKMVDGLYDAINILNLDAFEPQTQKENPLKCSACKVAVNKLRNWAEEEEKITEFLISLATYVCYDKLDLFSEEVCHGMIAAQAPVWFDSFWQHYTDPEILCPALKFCDPYYEKIDIDAVIQDILKDKPEHEQLVPNQKETIKFLQLSDVHTDFKYEEGLNSHCKATTCCRDGSGEPTSQEDASGYWGTIALCDIPNRTFEQAINFIKKNLPDLDFAIWSGDNTSHNLWNQTAEENVQNTIYQTKYIKKVYPEINMFPIFGNHEEYPANIYKYYNDDSEKQFKELFSNLWKDWLGEEAAQSLKEDGFYEIVVEKLNLKFIALNSQACYNENVALVYNPTDPQNTLQKLRKSLQESEDNNSQAVYIMQHIPTNKDCMNTWSKIFNAIIDRYSYIVRGIFTGHSHADELEVFYNSDNVAVNANFIAPSLTTYNHRKPSFRVFEADKETLQILNIYQYRLDIEYWNQFTDPNTQLEWEVAYDFLSEYNIPNMYEYQNIANVREKVGDDLIYYNKYSKNYYSGVYTDQDQINKNKYCRMLATNHLQAECLGIPFEPDFTELLAGPWMKKITDDKEFLSLD